MTSTKETPDSQAFTSPTPVAPVLIGFDGKDGGRDALALGRTLASARKCRCVVALPREDGALTDEARAALGDPDAETQPIGVLSPAQMLVGLARAEGAGTLVVGSSRLDKLGMAIAGTLAWHVLREAPCEVVVAPRGYAAEPHRGLEKIAVAVDGTPESKVALTRAEDLAREAGARIEVLVAEDPIVAGVEAEFPHDAPSSVADILQAAIGAVDPSLSPTGRRIDPGWRQVAAKIAKALGDACESDVDLLVTGSRRPIEQFLTGSVTKHLISAAPCPVLVVPHPHQPTAQKVS